MFSTAFSKQFSKYKWIFYIYIEHVSVIEIHVSGKHESEEDYTSSDMLMLKSV